jgi:hypothetical protein
MKNKDTKTLSPFEYWILKPAIIKKLQVFLALSLTMNCLFIYQISTKKQEQKTPNVKKEINQIKNEDLKLFINQYLNAFFGSNDTCFEFIKKHSSKELFEQSLKKEILLRREKNIKSKFQIVDLYLDINSNGSATSFITGVEIFENQEYINRNYFIEFTIDTTKLEITNIPKFEIKT